MRSQQEFAALLRRWRQRRGLSQLELAGHAGISQRHLSFLELARARPSREMVTLLATTLDLPLRQHNAFLVSAGFAPVWRESDFAAPELARVREALDYMLAQQEPFPAVVIDRSWNLLQANRGAMHLVEFLVGPLPTDARVNLADALIAPDVLRPYLVNWPEVARHFIRGVEADAAANGDGDTAALLERLLSCDGVRQVLDTCVGFPLPQPAGPILPIHFRKGNVSIELFTTIATLGTPQDVTVQELRIESFFPMCEETQKLLRSWSPN